MHQTKGNMKKRLMAFFLSLYTQLPFDVNVAHRFTHNRHFIKDDVTGIPDDNTKLVTEYESKYATCVNFCNNFSSAFQ